MFSPKQKPIRINLSQITKYSGKSNQKLIHQLTSHISPIKEESTGQKSDMPSNVASAMSSPLIIAKKASGKTELSLTKDEPSALKYSQRRAMTP